MRTMMNSTPNFGLTGPPCHFSLPGPVARAHASKSSCLSTPKSLRQPLTGRDDSKDRTSRPDVLPRLGASEPGAAQECYERYSPLVRSLARNYTSDPTEAEDAVQEVFLTLWKNASKFDPSKSPESAFVNMIARRRLIDFYRHKQRRPQHAGDETELETMPDRRALDFETRTEARLASRHLKVLDSRQREALLMSTYLGMSHSEIAREMEKPLGTVKTYIRRGLMRVREALESHELELEGGRE